MTTRSVRWLAAELVVSNFVLSHISPRGWLKPGVHSGNDYPECLYILNRYYQSSYFLFLFKRRAIRRVPEGPEASAGGVRRSVPECPEGSAGGCRSVRRGPSECAGGRGRSGFIQENILDNRRDSLVHTKDNLSLFSWSLTCLLDISWGLYIYNISIQILLFSILNLST